MATDRIDYSSIKSAVISFSNDLLDASAGDLFPKFDDFLFDQTNAVLDPDLLQIAFDQTEVLLTKCEGDTSCLSSILNKIFFKPFSLDVNKTISLRTQAAFGAAFEVAVRCNQDQVSIIAAVSNLQFHPDFQGNNLDLIFTSQAKMLSVPTYYGLRSWYEIFSGHGNACGVYIVAYELLSISHGGGQGFEFGTNIPSHKFGYGFDWQNDILCALQHSSMFSADSVCAGRVKNCQNG